MTLPFQVARQISNNLGEAFQKSSDQNAIDRILSESMASGDPEVLQNNIGKLLSQVSPERQQMALQVLQNKYSQLQEQQEKKQQRVAAKEAGYTYGAPPAVAAQQVKDTAKSARLSSYGLGGQVPQATQQPGQIQPSAQIGQGPIPSQANIPEIQQTPFEKFLRSRTKEQLIALQGHSDKEISEPSKAMLKQIEHEENLAQKEAQRTRDEELQFHKESQAYDDELHKQSKIAKKQVETIGDIEKAISSGNVTPRSMANLFKGLGKVGDKISEALVNKDEATLLASIPQLLEGWKEVFGVRLSDADLQLLQDKLPSIGKNPEANKAITNVLKKYADITLLRSKIAIDLKKSNNGLRPLGYADKIEERFDEMVVPVKIVNPKNGKVISIPAYKLSDALNAGAKLANE